MKSVNDCTAATLSIENTLAGSHRTQPFTAIPTEAGEVQPQPLWLHSLLRRQILPAAKATKRHMFVLTSPLHCDQKSQILLRNLAKLIPKFDEIIFGLHASTTPTPGLLHQQSTTSARCLRERLSSSCPLGTTSEPGIFKKMVTSESIPKKKVPNMSRTSISSISYSKQIQWLNQKVGFIISMGMLTEVNE